HACVVRANFQKGFGEGMSGQHAKKTALKGLMAKVSARGLDALDRRSAGYLALKKWREELVNDLGGEENLSAQVRLLVEIITRSKLFLDNVDLFLMEQASVVNRKRKAMLPL